MIKDEKLREIYKQISQGMSGLYNFFNYVEDSDIDNKELVLESIGDATVKSFAVLGHIHVLNKTWKLPGCGYVPLERELDNKGSGQKEETNNVE